MAAGVSIRHKRKAGAIVAGELAAGEWGLDITNSKWYYSVDGTSVVQLNFPGQVATVFGRQGTVVATSGDYAASQVSNDSGVAGTGVKGALDTLNSGKAATSHTHAASDINSGNIAAAQMQTNVVAAIQAGGGTLNTATLIIDGGVLP